MLDRKHINRFCFKTFILYLIFVSWNIYAETATIHLNSGQVISDVKSKLKSGEIYHEGDAGNSLYVLCYKSSDGAIISFESSEMGGKNLIITSIGFFSLQSPYRLEKNCSKSTEVNSKLKISGIYLGQSKSEIKNERNT